MEFKLLKETQTDVRKEEHSKPIKTSMDNFDNRMKHIKDWIRMEDKAKGMHSSVKASENKNKTKQK